MLPISGSKTASKWSTILLLLISLWGAALSAGYALINPPLYAPDEGDHLAFINYVCSTGKLPVQLRPETQVPEGHQNPLYYYTVGKGLAFSTKGPVSIQSNVHPGRAGLRAIGVSFAGESDKSKFYGLRLLNSALVGFLILSFGALCKDHLKTAMWWLGPLLLASLPQLSFIGGAINNDILNALLATVALRSILANPGAKAGVLSGLAFIAKKSSLILLPVGLGVAYADRSKPKVLWFIFAMSLFVVPILARNQLLYGEFLGTKMEEMTYPILVNRHGITKGWFNYGFNPAIWRSSIGMFGLMDFRLPDNFYAAWAFAAVPFLCSLTLVQERRVWVPLLVFGLSAAGVVYYNFSYTQPQGRLLWTGLSSAFLLISIGYERIFERLVRPWFFAAVIALFSVGSALFALQFFWKATQNF